MDPLTQTALGAAVGALFRPQLGGKAVAVGAACGFAPDLDVFASYAGEFVELVHHRGLTHALPVLTLISPAAGWLARRRAGTGTWLAWTHLAFWALVTHPLLDWCTTYGTQLLLPFTDCRFANDAVSVIDPLATLPLLIAVAVNLRWTTTARRQAVWAATMLALFVGYLGFGFAQSRAAVRFAEDQLRRDAIEVDQVRAPATMFNVFLRRVVVRTADGDLLVGHVSTLALRPIEFAAAKGLTGETRRAVLGSREGRIFVWFAEDLLAIDVGPPDAGPDVVFSHREIVLSDQRYGLVTRPLASPFRAAAVLSHEGEATDWRRLPRDAVPDLGRELRVLWQAAVTGDVPPPGSGREARP